MAKLKLNEEFIAKACEYLESGNYTVTVCSLMGVSEECWYSWIRKAEEAIKEGKKNIYVQFYESVLRADAEAERRNVEFIEKAGATDWKAAAWYLARKGKSKWLEKQEIEITDGNNIKVTLTD